MPIPPEFYYKKPSSTARLRDIKNAAHIAIAEIANKEYYNIIDSITLHFFEDCILAFARYTKDMKQWKTFGVFSKSRGKVWVEYKDQFEPKEGYHAAVEYKPHDASFPTKEW